MQSHGAMNEKLRDKVVVADGLLLWLERSWVLSGRAVPLCCLSVVSLWALTCSCKCAGILLLWDCPRIWVLKSDYSSWAVVQHSLVDNVWCYGVKKKNKNKTQRRNHLISNIIEARHFWKAYFLLVPGRQQISTLPEVRAGLGTAWGLNARWNNAGRISWPSFTFGH